MLSAASPRSSQEPSQWMAPPAASWTSEEINMIQEIFLSDEKAIQIRDISIINSKQPVAQNLLTIPTEYGSGTTSILLSPIGADEAFLERFMVDEKDAMNAFFLETLDPFKKVSVTPVHLDSNEKQKLVSAVPSPSDGRLVDHVLVKLRNQVDALNRIYYSRCMNVSCADDSTINKVKLVLAIERLQRVIEGLSTENTQLKTDTMSYVQRCELLVHANSACRAEVEQLRQSIEKSTCAAAVTEAMNVILNCSMEEGQVLRDHQSEDGWNYKSIVSSNGLFTYTLSKEYPKEVNMHDVMHKSWTSVSSSENFSCMYYGAIKAQLVKRVDKKAVIMYDVANHDATRVDRVVAVLFRVELPNGFLMGARSLDVFPTTTSENVRQMDCTMWQRYEYKETGGFCVTSGGQLSYPSRADIEFMAVEILCLHLRWENRVVGPRLLI